jgi:hypothetical protein
VENGETADKGHVSTTRDMYGKLQTKKCDRKQMQTVRTDVDVGETNKKLRLLKAVYRAYVSCDNSV